MNDRRSAMKSRIALAAAIALLMFTASPAMANYQFFRAVQEAAKAYRVEIGMEQMKMVSDGKGGQAFYVTLQSNRNNFDMVMMVGYIAAGEAMKLGEKPSQIFVSIDVPVGGGFRLVTMCSREDLERLIDGEINSAQFARLINYL